MLTLRPRVDIALAIGAQGVHVGQDDMPIEVARSLLGPNAIIGVSAGTVTEAKAAVAGGVDYIGIGAVYPTGSKSNAKLLGVRGVGPILSVLEATDVKSVVIGGCLYSARESIQLTISDPGGIKSVNLLRTLHGCVSPNGKHVDGVAVISEIIASQDPEGAASHLSSCLRSFYAAGPSFIIGSATATATTIPSFANVLDVVRKHGPMVHQITNNVVINQSANATLALGASPIMATSVEEQEDLAKIPGGLLINFGTVTDKEGMLAAGKWANFNRKPVVFDPVGVGATGFRKTVANGASLSRGVRQFF